jgi:hypothetical protein
MINIKKKPYGFLKNGIYIIYIYIYIMEDTVTTAIHQIDELLDAKNTTITTYNNDEFISNSDDIKILCGDFLYDSVVYLIDMVDESQIRYMVKDTGNIVIGVFIGYNEPDKLESSYTCATSGFGELLRYYALLNSNLTNPTIVRMYGGISGGIPPLREDDTPDLAEEKYQRLVSYHKKRGADIVDNVGSSSEFIYNLPNVIDRVTYLYTKFNS